METLPTSARLATGQTLPQGGSRGAALGGPKKPMPTCNAPDMPTSVWSEMARKYVEPILTGKANDNRRSSVDAPGVLVSRHSTNHGRLLVLLSGLIDKGSSLVSEAA